MGLRQVFYEGWQMECCGTAFTVGEEVTWPLVPVDPQDVLGEDCDEEKYGGMRRVERHGGSGTPQETRGRVRAIHLLSRVYAESGPGSRTFEPVPGEWSLEATGSCPNWFGHGEPSTGPGPRRRRIEVGVLVTLEVPPAAPSESRDRR